ncbi:anti-sigma factor [Streptomyces sp. NPDC000151]|uniref:anti-sigma factor n=1 Tax=Streptomyces sp. NPDC000151 TaxID=3154244 RepID=UPI00331F0E3B
MTGADLHTLTGAYALHALPDDERAEFERHLAVCESCAQEVRELSATAGRLGLAVSVTPRPGLKDDVLRRITTVRQEAPRTPRPPHSGPVSARARRLTRWALAACLAIAAALGGVAVWQHDRAEDAREEARRAQQHTEDLAAVLGARDAKARTARWGKEASGTVVVSRSRDQAVFIASGMSKPPDGKVYQLWFDDNGTMRSAGMLDPARPTAAVMMGPLGRASGMGITMEPAGGSPRPTSAPLTMVHLPA